jgi:hypothetical protein
MNNSDNVSLKESENLAGIGFPALFLKKTCAKRMPP